MAVQFSASVELIDAPRIWPAMKRSPTAVIDPPSVSVTMPANRPDPRIALTAPLMAPLVPAEVWVIRPSEMAAVDPRMAIDPEIDAVQ